MRLFVGSLSFDTREDDLQQAFSAYGTPTSATVITDRDTGRSKGFGFVEFASAEEAKKAIEGLNGKELQGRTITVAEARPREERGGGERRQQVADHQAAGLGDVEGDRRRRGDYLFNADHLRDPQDNRRDCGLAGKP